ANDGMDVTDWRAEAALRGRQLQFENVDMPNLDGGVSFDRGRVTVDIAQDGLSITVDATVRDSVLDGSFALTLPRLDIVAELAGIDDVEGQFTADGALSGSLEAPGVVADLTGSRISYQNVPIDTLGASLSYGERGLVIADAFIEGGLDSIDPFDPLLGIDSLTGAFTYRATASGPVDSLTAGLQATLRGLTYGAYTLDSGFIEAGLDGMIARLQATRLFYRSMELAATGEYAIDSVSGSAEFRFTSHGGLIDSAIAAQLVSADTAEEATAETVDAGRLTVDFDLADTLDYDIDLSGDSLSLSALAALMDEPLAVGGLLGLEGSFDGSPTRPNARLRLSIEQPVYDQVRLDSLRADVAVDTVRAEMTQLHLDGFGQRLAMQGAVNLTRDSLGSITVSESSALAGKITSDGVDLHLLEPFLPEGAALQGQSSINLKFDGTMGMPHLVGNIDVRDGMLVPAAGMDSVQQINIALVLEDTTVVIDTAHARFSGSPLVLDGSVVIRGQERAEVDLGVNLTQYGRMSLSGTVSQEELDLDARIDTLRLQALAPFVAAVDTLAGQVTAQVSISGTVDAPDMDGSIDVRGLTVKPTALDSTLTDGMARLRFTDSRADIDTMSARLGGGRLWLEGYVVVGDGGLSEIDLTTHAREIAAGVTEMLTLRVDSADIRYSGGGDSYRLDGLVVLGETRFTRDFAVGDLLSNLTAVEQVDQAATDIEKNTVLDVRVRNSGSLWIDNNLARIRLSAATGFIGTLAQWNMTGRVKVEEGYVLYLDREFKITRGVAFFTDPNRFNPEVDLAAQTQVRVYRQSTPTDYTITLAASGPLDQLETSLTSQPPLDRPSIVSLLTVGATREELVGGESGTGDILLDRAGELASRQLTSFASRRVESALGLEQVSVQGNLFGPQREGGPQLLVSKRLSERVRVTYTTRVGSRNDQSIRLDYRLSDHWSLEGETTQTGEAVLNIKYGLRFK
ncbi:DUF748 domain-containing protein, partial [candidate division GN15 bacterium]|nr:DUF748 domain-containing protein [candidate division GN15 bacterium]